jgi:hypothetical protein
VQNLNCKGAISHDCGTLADEKKNDQQAGFPAGHSLVTAQHFVVSG